MKYKAVMAVILALYCLPPAWGLAQTAIAELDNIPWGLNSGEIIKLKGEPEQKTPLVEGGQILKYTESLFNGYSLSSYYFSTDDKLYLTSFRLAIPLANKPEAEPLFKKLRQYAAEQQFLPAPKMGFKDDINQMIVAEATWAGNKTSGAFTAMVPGPPANEKFAYLLIISVQDAGRKRRDDY